MQSPIDPRAERMFVDRLVSGGIAALVAERIVQTKGEQMQTAPEAQAHATHASNGAPPSPEPLMNMLQGLQVAGILKGGIELGVFDEIAAGHREANSIASAVGADPRATRILLDALVAVGVLSGGADYRLSPVADAFLVRSRPTYIGGAADIFTGTWAWENYGRVADIVRSGGTLMQEDAETPSLDFWTTFASSSTGIATPSAEGLADALAPWTGEHDELAVLDVACGSGLYGLAIARSHPAGRLTLLDWGNVLDRARANVERFDLTDRTTYLDGDAFETDLGGPYDVIVVSHFFHHFSERRCRQALTRFAAALKPGGRIAINEFTAVAENPAAEPFPALFSVVMLAWTREGAAHHTSDYERWLADTGFAAPEIHAGRGMPSRFIIAERRG
jgi:ubiquinone/menaquinone biosynthesis C-methylase UbiE